MDLSNWVIVIVIGSFLIAAACGAFKPGPKRIIPSFGERKPVPRDKDADLRELRERVEYAEIMAQRAYNEMRFPHHHH